MQGSCFFALISIRHWLIFSCIFNNFNLENFATNSRNILILFFSVFFFQLVWALNPWSHPSPRTCKGANWARAPWLRKYYNNACKNSKLLIKLNGRYKITNFTSWIKQNKIPLYNNFLSIADQIIFCLLPTITTNYQLVLITHINIVTNLAIIQSNTFNFEPHYQ